MTARQENPHLGVVGRVTAKFANSSGVVAFASAAVLVTGAWLLVVLMAGSLATVQIGPGGALTAFLPDIELPGFLPAVLKLCLQPAVSGEAEPLRLIALSFMWLMMSVAMMLPSAAPLIRTYCEIADTARSQNQAVAHPLWLVAGYLCAWTIASCAYAAGVLVVQKHSPELTGLYPLTGPVAAATLATAGVYQFTGLKNACLSKCRHPFATLFANWSSRPSEILRLGIRQGFWCIGCCWALMLVMLVVGLMNLIWMALLTVLVLVEKTIASRIATYGAGSILLVWASAVLLVS